MAFPRVSWRVGLPFVLLVLLASVALALFTSNRLTAAEDERFQRVAVATGLYLDNASLPPSSELANDLRRITGNTVLFRRDALLEPPPPRHLADLPLTTLVADRTPVRHGRFVCIAVPLDDKPDLVIVREDDRPAIDPVALQIVGAFALLAVLVTWLVARGLTRPLHHLAAQLPQIESPAPLTLPEASRADEIGDLARALLRTNQALRDERTARERLEKLAVLGRMTAALAHEVQNPVAAIRMHAQLWRDGASPDAAATIENEASRIEALLNQWLYLTRPEPPTRAPVDLGALLMQVVASQRAQAEHAAVAVHLEAAAGLVVPGDGKRLQHVFRNLLTNALQAMPGGGTVAFTAVRTPEHVMVTCRDSGPGFSAAALQRFAEYFFSEREGGMGIGLAVASEITKAHGGSLAAANHPGGGALLTVTLPFSGPPDGASP